MLTCVLFGEFVVVSFTQTVSPISRHSNWLVQHYVAPIYWYTKTPRSCLFSELTVVFEWVWVRAYACAIVSVSSLFCSPVSWDLRRLFVSFLFVCLFGRCVHHSLVISSSSYIVRTTQHTRPTFKATPVYNEGWIHRHYMHK